MSKNVTIVRTDTEQRIRTYFTQAKSFTTKALALQAKATQSAFLGTLEIARWRVENNVPAEKQKKVVGEKKARFIEAIGSSASKLNRNWVIAGSVQFHSELGSMVDGPAEAIVEFLATVERPNGQVGVSTLRQLQEYLGMIQEPTLADDVVALIVKHELDTVAGLLKAIASKRVAAAIVKLLDARAEKASKKAEKDAVKLAA